MSPELCGSLRQPSVHSSAQPASLTETLPLCGTSFRGCKAFLPSHPCWKSPPQAVPRGMPRQAPSDVLIAGPQHLRSSGMGRAGIQTREKWGPLRKRKEARMSGLTWPASRWGPGPHPFHLREANPLSGPLLSSTCYTADFLSKDLGQAGTPLPVQTHPFPCDL